MSAGKRCSRCRRDRPLTAFGRRAASADGLPNYCRECVAAWAREHRPRRLVGAPEVGQGAKWCRSCQTTRTLTEFAANRSAGADARRRYLDKSYGLTEQQLTAMLREQDGLCSICLTAPAVHVDHDHATGTVRGMRCFSCNAALGHFRDDPAVLRRAAEYLEESRHPTTTSARDEAAWAAVLTQVPASGPSRLEQAFRQRLADATGGPTP